jgi:uncharacterized protein YpmB
MQKQLKGSEIKKTTGLTTATQFEDVNTYDIDTVVVDGNNRSEIMGAIEILLTKKGFKMYRKLHKWNVIYAIRTVTTKRLLTHTKHIR